MDVPFDLIGGSQKVLAHAGKWAVAATNQGAARPTNSRRFMGYSRDEYAFTADEARHTWVYSVSGESWSAFPFSSSPFLQVSLNPR